MKQAPAISSWRLFWRVIGLLWPYRGWIVLGLLCALAASLSGIALLALSGWFLSSMAIAGVAGVTMNYFTPAAIIRGLALVRISGRYAERLINHDVTLRALAGLRLWLYGRLWPLSPGQTAMLGHSQLFSRMRADIDRLEHVYLAVFMPAVMALIGFPLMLFVTAGYLGAAAMGTAVIALLAGVVLPLWAQRRSRATGEAWVAAEATLRQQVGDAILGAAELELYGQADVVAARLAELSQAQEARKARLDSVQSAASGLVPWAAATATAWTLWLGAAAAGAGRLAGPDVAMLCLLAMAGFELIGPLPEAMSQLVASLASARRVFELADQSARSLEPVAEPVATVSERPSIQCRHVAMRYEAQGPWVLQDVDLALPAGRRIALLGPSGAGKSSLLQALLRFEPIEQGVIEVDGIDIRRLDPEVWRSRISVVEQRTHIFNASLRDNLLIARPGASEAQLQAALQGAQLENFVAGLPEGLETWLGEGGALISGGEARRVAIARALLADRPVLLLDEPTEGLDPATAQSLLGALETLTRGRTVLLISHQLAGLQQLVEQRYRLVHGRCVALD
ncbi:thiol reductant ABC exporter subunit CydC [Frateuria aurantia]